MREAALHLGVIRTATLGGALAHGVLEGSGAHDFARLPLPPALVPPVPVEGR